MIERPVPFTEIEVTATIGNRKTQFFKAVRPMRGEQSRWLTLEKIRRVPHGEMINGGWQMHHYHAGQTVDGARVAEDSPLGWIRCPYGVPGDRLWVKETLWISDCGKYVARPVEDTGRHETMLDVVDRATRKWWLVGRYHPTGWDDTDPRYTHCEFPSMVVGWTNLGRYTRGGARDGRWIPAFKQDFCDVDQAVEIDSFTGNVILRRYSATFRKRFPSTHMPRWAARLILEVVNVRVIRIQDISEEDAEAEGNYAGYHTPRNPERGPTGGIMQTRRVATFWDSLNPNALWAGNPWAWLVDFKRVLEQVGGIDA